MFSIPVLVKDAETTWLVASPSTAMALTVVVAFRVKGSVYGVLLVVGSVPSSV